jgi:hypothetical protein
MNQRFLMWGLTSIAFVVTLAISSWQEGLWQPDTLPVHSARAASPFAEVDEPSDSPARPLAPMHITPPPPTQTVAAVIPPPPVEPAPQEAPPAEEPPEQPSAQDLDQQDFADHRDREAGRSARTR